MKNILSILLALFSITAVSAQSITEAVLEYRRDVIPSSTSSASLRYVHLLPAWSSLEAEYRLQAMTLDEAYGLDGRSLQLHGLNLAYAFPLFDGRLFLSGGPRLEVRSGDELNIAPGYILTVKGALLPDGGEHTVSATLAVDRGYYQAGVLSIDHNILRDRMRLNLSGDAEHLISVSLNAERLFLSDRNVIDHLNGYLLIHVLRSPDVSIGYGFQYSDSRTDRWSSTTPVFDTGTGLYRYTYFYVPYFTPLKEQGHLALGSIRLPLSTWMAIRARASVPFSSNSRRTWTMDEGVDQTPVLSELRYKEHDVLQTTVAGALEFELAPTRWLAVELEHFDKPYYTYTQAQMKLTMTF